MAKGKRIAIEPNIYRYVESGLLEGRVRMGTLPARVKPFAADTDLSRIRSWIETQRRELTEELRAFGEIPPQARRRRGTLEADVETFLPQIQGRSCFRADRSHLRAWLAVVVPGDATQLGQLDRSSITTAHVNSAIAIWQAQPSSRRIRKVRVGGFGRGTSSVKAHDRSAPATSGSVVSARTIRHRCRMLADLFHTLDGKKAATPVDEAKVPKVPKTLPPRIPIDVLHSILVTLRTLDLPTFCRYAVCCTTLQRPVQVMRAELGDVDLDKGIWIVRSAKNEPAHTITLERDAIRAWKAFIAAKCWGEFDTTKYGAWIHEAGLPKGLRPYAARHTGAVGALENGVNLGDLQGLLGHGSPETTRRFYAPFVIDRQRKASKKLDGRFAGVFGPRLVAKG